jgi:hypothetical protein
MENEISENSASFARRFCSASNLSARARAAISLTLRNVRRLSPFPDLNRIKASLSQRVGACRATQEARAEHHGSFACHSNFWLGVDSIFE